ncbi:MAG: response regulator [Lachnospiraceae bacterium]|nr:response regulator [Lachnospiraceae bacterium]
MLSKRKMVFTAEKESFIVRVLVKKAQDAGIDCVYVPFDITAIHSALAESQLLALYMEEDTMPKDDIIHLIIDNMEEIGGQVVLVGERDDVGKVFDHMPTGLVYKTFLRPVDNAEFAAALTEYYEKVESGDLKKSILVVDDDPGYLAIVRQWLSGTYRVALASSGLQAIKYLGKNKVDLILLDHEMPVTSGPQVLEMLRSEDETKGIPVMFLTGKSDKESVMAVVALHPEGYFLKSIKKEELLNELHKYFSTHMA